MNEINLIKALFLPDEPTEHSLWKSREIIKTYARNGREMPPKLFKHLDMLLDAKPSREVQKQLRDTIKGGRVQDVLVLQYYCYSGNRMKACEKVIARDQPLNQKGKVQDPKTLYDNVSRKGFSLTDPEIEQLIEETIHIYGTGDPEELEKIILENKITDEL